MVEDQRLREGKIKWFGGHNSQMQENAYGFIEDTERGDIYVNKQHVNPADLPILGKDLIVNYILKFNPTKQKHYAIQVTAKRVVGLSYTSQAICEYLVEIRHGQKNFIESKRLNPNIFDDRKKIIDFAEKCKIDGLSKIINYFILCGAEKFIFKLVKSFCIAQQHQKKEEEILTDLILVNPYLLRVFPNFIAQLEHHNILKILHDLRILDFNNNLIGQLLDKYLVQPSNARNLEKSNDLIFSLLRLYQNTWHYLSVAGLTRLYLLKDGCFTDSQKDQIINIIIEKIKRNPPDYDMEVWGKIGLLVELVAYHGHLWNVAPNFVKIEVIRKRFSTFLELIEEWKSYRPRHLSKIRIPCTEAYKFTDDDKTLVDMWVDSSYRSASAQPSLPQSNFLVSTMYSARGAEKAAILHYQSREATTVLDVAIDQVKKLSENWKFYDLYVECQDNWKLLDVKNARSSLSNKNRFSEFCVPRFKKRNSNEISIVGVFSPYISDLPENPAYGKKITILGETQHSTLESLQDRCKKVFQGLEITIQRASKFNSHSQYLAEYLAPWLFDFDDEFYKERHQIEKRFNSFDENDIPYLSELSLLGLNPLSLALCSRSRFPSHWEKEIEPSILRFHQILKSIIGNDPHLTLAHLFLSILIHFLENCLKTNPGFSPTIYRKLILTDSPMAMGICDPLSIIPDICEILEKVWKTCAEELTNFSYFKFDSRGLLKGYNRNTKKISTIIAYCGGWKKDRKGGSASPCGNEPLYIGRHKNCLSCHHLICDQCDFCSSICDQSYAGPHNRKTYSLGSNSLFDEF